MTRSGVGGLRLQVPVHLLVQRVLVVGQVEAREQRVLVEQEIGHRRLPEHVELRELAQLVDALEQERELRGQREARHVVVEARQERIVLRLLEQHSASRCSASWRARLVLPAPIGPSTTM